MLRFMFMIVIACHIPFIFFSGKEGTLIVIDELDRGSISKALKHKLGAQGPDPEDENLMEPVYDLALDQG